MTWMAHPPTTSLNILDMMLCEVPWVLQAAILYIASYTSINMTIMASTLPLHE